MLLRLAILTTLLALPVLADSPDPEVQRVRLLLRAGEVDKAFNLAEQLVKKDEKRSDYQHALGMCYGRRAIDASIFSAVSHAKKCKKAFERAVQLDPSNVDARADLLLYYVNAPGIMGGDLAKARSEAGEIAKLDAVKGHVAEATIAQKQKNQPRAETEYRLALEAEPAKAGSYVPLIGYYIRQKKPAEAVATCRKGLATLPDDPLLHYQMARIASSLGTELDAGLDHVEKFLAKEAPADGPSWADANWRKGLILEKQGKKDLAVAAYRLAVKLEPLHQASKELKRLAS